MIKEESYSKDWLSSHRSKKGLEKINPPLVEKMVHALGLVEQLSLQGLEFVFKGGTSLVLLLEDAGRFSIDIDIVTLASRQRIEAVLEAICSHKLFHRVELNEYRSYKEGVPKAHYSLYYHSALSGKEEHILLDILFADHDYPILRELPIQTEWLSTDQTDVLVKAPSIESIAGDKLTAFAPNTTGVPYGKGKEVEIIKQLHDVGKLYDGIKDVEATITSFERLVVKEIQYRRYQCEPNDVLGDILETGLMIIKREKNKDEPDRSRFQEIKLGLLQFKSYQTRKAFRIDEAIIASGKAAVLAGRIKARDASPLPKFNQKMQKEPYLVKGSEFSLLNKLPAEALFYWYHAIDSFYRAAK